MTDETLEGALATLVDPATSADPLRMPATGDSMARHSLTDYDNQLILDLVANLRPAADTLSRYGLTQADLVAKARNPEWSNRYREQRALWNSDVNLRERIRAKAAYLLEDSLVPLFAIIAGKSTHSAKLAAIEQLVKISTVAHVPKDEHPPGPGRQIAIHFGGSQPREVIIATETENERTAIRIAAPADPTGN